MRNSHTPRHLSRSKSVRTGLAGTGVMSLALAGGAFAVASTSPAQAASATLTYSCGTTDSGIKFSDPWQVTLSANTPQTVAPGEAIPATTVTAKVTAGKDASAIIELPGNSSLTGTASVSYSAGGATGSTALTVPTTAIPASGNFSTTATGSIPAMKAPTTPGTINLVASDFKADLTLNTGYVAHVGCTLAAGQSGAFATIKVAAPATTTSAPTSTTSTPTTTSSTSTPTSTAPSSTSTSSKSSSSSSSAGTTSAPSTSTGSSTATRSSSSSASSTASSSSTAASSSSAAPTTSTASKTTPAGPGNAAPSSPATGPKVQTDGASGSNSMNVLGVGLSAMGVVTLGGAYALGRKRIHN